MDRTQMEQRLCARFGQRADLRIRPLRVAGRPGFLIFADSLVDKTQLNRDLIAPLQAATQVETLDDLVASVNVAGAYPMKSDLDTVDQEVVKGRAVVLVQGLGALRAEIATPEHRKVDEPEYENTTRGPRDSFVEQLTVNLGLIRIRLKDPRLEVEQLSVGTRSQTSVALVYMSDLVNPAILRTVRERLHAINVDGVIDDAVVEEYLSERLWSPFPHLRPTERPDWLTWEVLQGKVGIVVDGSATALVGPVTVVDFYRSPEDYKHSAWVATFSRLLRAVGFILALFLPSLYVALTDVTPELLPTQLALAIAGSREGVPFPAVVEVLFMEIALELLRESTLRMPKILGSTIGIVGGLVLGQAAVSAKLVSDIMIIVMSLTAMAQFTAPSQEMGEVWRTTRWLFTLTAGVFGLYGLALISFVVLFHMAGLNSLGVPYLWSASPAGRTFWSDGMVRLPLRLLRRRPRESGPQDEIRAGAYLQSPFPPEGGSHAP